MDQNNQELEDGELTSDEETGKPLQPDNNMNQFKTGKLYAPSEYTDFDSHEDVNFDYKELPRPRLPCAAPGRINLDLVDNHSTSEESESDEDEECTASIYSRSHPNAKRSRRADVSKTKSNFSNPNANYSVSFHHQMEATLQARRINNVWGDVMREQQVESAADILEKVTLQIDPATRVFQRGPETFSIEGAKTGRKRSAVELYQGNSYDKIQLNNFYDSENSISSGGLSEDSKEFVRNSNLDETAEVKEGKKPTSGRKGKKESELDMILSKLSDVELTKFIAEKLCEQKEDIIANAIRLLGRDVIIKLFKKTIRIEFRGGLLIKSGARKRSPGGVFIYMLRQNKNFDQSIVDLIVGPPPEEINRRLGSRPRRYRKTK